MMFTSLILMKIFQGVSTGTHMHIFLYMILLLARADVFFETIHKMFMLEAILLPIDSSGKLQAS